MLFNVQRKDTIIFVLPQKIHFVVFLKLSFKSLEKEILYFFKEYDNSNKVYETLAFMFFRVFVWNNFIFRSGMK